MNYSSVNVFIKGMTSSNLNWLVFKMYQLKNYDYCKQLIEQQMKENFNQEYLFYIKVSINCITSC